MVNRTVLAVVRKFEQELDRVVTEVGCGGLDRDPFRRS